MTSRDEEDAWRAIVENYGERPSLDQPDQPDQPDEQPAGLPEEPPDAPSAGAFDPDRDFDPYSFPEPEEPEDESDDQRFVPPLPPPPPTLEPRRRAAWAAVLGTPVLLACVAMTGWAPPSFVSFLLVGGFLAGFGYLVATMPRGPRDPWDDGAQV